jgi:hypothetical protein
MVIAAVRAVVPRPRRLTTAVLLAALLVAIPEPWGWWVRGAPPVAGPVAGVPGRWLYVSPRRGVAWAHGLPMDIWIVNADGSGLQQLTEIGEDDPIPAWSPDGRWIVFTAAGGLYLLDPGRKAVLRLHEDNGGGGFTWLRP